MSTLCRKVLQRFLAAGGLVLACAAVPARAELADDVTTFLSDYDRLAAVRQEVATDRDAMAGKLGDAQALKKAVREFFNDRDQAQSLRVLKAADRKQMRATLKALQAKEPGSPAAKTGGGGSPATNSLLQDATAFIANYDQWLALQAVVTQDIAQLRVDVAGVNADPASTYAAAALIASTKKFFDDSRARLNARLQWQAAVRALKKDVGFKGTGKPQPPQGETLTQHVAHFLSDRAEWETLGTQLDADRNNIRAALGATESLTSVVMSFLTDRRARRVKGQELALDRKVMRADLGLRSSKEGKTGALFGSRDLDTDDEDDALDQSSDESGEK